MDFAISRKTTLGGILAIMAVASWGLLPVVSKSLLSAMDPYTLNFFRFSFACVVLLLYAIVSQRKVNLAFASSYHYALLALAVAALILNQFVFMGALRYIPATTSQIIIQLGPIGLLLLSVFFLGESFKKVQWLGLILFTVGLVVFFSNAIAEVFALKSDYAVGVAYMTVASLVWIFFGLAQKLLTHVLSVTSLLLCCYLFGVLILIPMSSPGVLMSLNTVQLWLLLASCVVSLSAYFCFGESLRHWEASRSSALLATIPIVTWCYEELFSVLTPQYVSSSPLSFATAGGAVIVVVGCFLVARK